MDAKCSMVAAEGSAPLQHRHSAAQLPRGVLPRLIVCPPLLLVPQVAVERLCKQLESYRGTNQPGAPPPHQLLGWLSQRELAEPRERHRWLVAFCSGCSCRCFLILM